MKWKNPSVLGLCPFDVPNLRTLEVRPLRIPNRQPPLAVSVGQFQRLQCLVVKRAGTCQGHSHSLWQTHVGTTTAETSCGPGHFNRPCSHSLRRRRRGLAEQLFSVCAVSCCTASSPGQTLLSQYLTEGGSSRTDISSLSEGQYAMRKKNKIQFNSSGGFS